MVTNYKKIIEEARQQNYEQFKALYMLDNCPDGVITDEDEYVFELVDKVFGGRK